MIRYPCLRKKKKVKKLAFCDKWSSIFYSELYFPLVNYVAQVYSGLSAAYKVKSNDTTVLA